MATTTPPPHDAIMPPMPPFRLAEDPLQYPHRFDNPLDIECVAFICALFAYGQRAQIVALLGRILAPLGQHPVQWLCAQTPDTLETQLFDAGLSPFRYRFNTQADYLFLLQRLQWVYQHVGSLQQLLQQVKPPPNRNTTYQDWLADWMDVLLGEHVPDRNGVKYLLAHPRRGGSCKRLHLFLRWMVRGPDELDFGLWRGTLDPSQLIIPLDTHVSKAARHLGWVTRSANDWQTAEHITAHCRVQYPNDPCQADVELFLLGQGLMKQKRQGTIT
jgi:uncharacterized protein (TIGR02757 family)